MLLKEKNSLVEYNTNNHAISGDLNQASNDLVTYQTKKKLDLKLIHADAKPVLKYLDMKDLVSLQTQREAKATWARDRIKARGGLDLIALGTLSVARDPNTGIYYVWDGCGRWLILETWKEFTGNSLLVPCMVWDMDPELASYYFSYCQSEGRRNQTPEVIFINYAKYDHTGEARWVERLKKLDLFVKNDCLTQLPISDELTADANEVRIRSIKNTWDIVFKKTKDEKETLRIMQQVVDVLRSAHKDANVSAKLLRQDMLFALAEVLTQYRFLVDNNSNRKNLIKFLETQLTLNKNTDNLTENWKREAKSLTGNAGVSKILAHYFCKTFKASSIPSESLKTKITYTKDFKLN